MGSYDRGLLEVADRVHAYLQPDGGWGWSNAGLVDGGDESLLVDTLFDVGLTEQMLSSMTSITGTAPIRRLVNTHANGDHCYGNVAVKRQVQPADPTGHEPSPGGSAGPDFEIIASAASAAEMENLPPAALAAMMAADFGPLLNDYLDEAFGAFTFDGIEYCPPTVTFTSTLSLTVGDRPVDLIEVGPAHTKGDILVHLPEDGVVFTGDILFIGSTPIVWDGPIANWLAACGRILAMGCSVIVPGHGPLTDAAGVRAVHDYLAFVHHEAGQRRAVGMTAAEAARDIDLGPYRDWLDWERIAINVDTVYRELEAAETGVPLEHMTPTGVMDLFQTMAEIKTGR